MNRKKRRHFIIQKGGWGSSVGRGKYYDHVEMGSKKVKKIKELEIKRWRKEVSMLLNK